MVMVSQIISEDIDQNFPKNWDHCWGVGVVGHLSCNNILSGDSFEMLQFCTGFAISVQRKFNISGKLSETIAFAGVDYFFGTDTTGKRLKFISNKVSLKAKSFKSWKNLPQNYLTLQIMWYLTIFTPTFQYFYSYCCYNIAFMYIHLCDGENWTPCALR